MNLAVCSDDLTQPLHLSMVRAARITCLGDVQSKCQFANLFPVTMTQYTHSRNPWSFNCIERFDIRRKTAGTRPRNRSEIPTTSRAEAHTRKGPKSRIGRYSKHRWLSRASQRFASDASLAALNLAAYSTDLLPPQHGAGVDACVNIVDIRARRRCTPLLVRTRNLPRGSGGDFAKTQSSSATVVYFLP